MHFIQGRVRDYAWGSTGDIPNFFGLPEASFPVAELWLGAHAGAPARFDVDRQAIAISPDDLRPGQAGIDARAAVDKDLRSFIASDSVAALGRDVANRSNNELPFLLKLIAPGQPISMQVHPSIAEAQVGFARENEQGIALDAPERSYKDANHKPELVYALTEFEALVGFRSPRRIIGVLEGLDTPLTNELTEYIWRSPNAAGVRDAFASLLSEGSRPDARMVDAVVEACANRPAEDSPSPRADGLIGKLAAFYPGDPGVVASLLLNPVTLQPGEAMFTPAGTVHAYTLGMGIEIMANSDNVLRAGLTSKYVDVPELLRVVETVAAPPIRIAPERISPVQSTYYAPVDDFELSIIELRDANARVKLHGGGPRIVLCLYGATELWTSAGEYCIINTGQAVFLRADDGVCHVRGAGRLVQANVP